MTNRQSACAQAPSRRDACERYVRISVRRIVDASSTSGFTREEILIAISDVADKQLADLTESLSGNSAPCPCIIPFSQIPSSRARR